jgi:hypothetical protein
MFDHDRPVPGVSGVGGGGGAREAGDRDVIEMVDPEERVGFGVLYPQDRRPEVRHQIHEGGEQRGPVVDLGLPDRGIRIPGADPVAGPIRVLSGVSVLPGAIRLTWWVLVSFSCPPTQLRRLAETAGPARELLAGVL